MGINELIEILEPGPHFSDFSIYMFVMAFVAVFIGFIIAFSTDELGILMLGGFIGFVFATFGMFAYATEHETPKDMVNHYIKSLDENKVYVSDIEKNKIRVTGVSSKKDVNYASVQVDGSNQKLGVFKTEMKVVSDVKKGDGSYITYKKLKKTLPGFYKKGWVKATLHVESGTSLMDLDKYVDANAGGTAVGSVTDRDCGKSAKYVFVKEKGKLTIVCVGKSFSSENVFKGQTGEVLTYTSFKDAKDWLVENIKEDKIDPAVLEAKEAADNESFYK